MTLLPLTDCCLLLGIDPKTLRLWLTSAHLCWTRHPSDARLKCLTESQLQQLATLHARMLPESLASTVGTASPRLSAPGPATAEPAVALPCFPSCPEPSAQAALLHTLTQLQTQVATLQEQVTHLALAVLREREWHWEERLSHPSAPLPSSTTSTAPLAHRARPATSPSRHHETAPRSTPADPSSPLSRSRSRALPLIE